MKRDRRGRFVKWLAAVVAAIVACILGAFLITRGAAFGGRPAGERLARAERSPEWRNGQFASPQPLWSDSGGAWRRLLFGPAATNADPTVSLAVVHGGAAVFRVPPTSGLRVTWFGHSSALIEIDGAAVLVDPFWSDRASPVRWAGPKRWYPAPVALTDLPVVDVVVISHDHHDHLDYAAVTAMRSSRSMFVVPLGIGAHLARWGIPESRIIELDWWEKARVGGLEIVATPARHASGRISTKSNRTLWAGFALLGARHRAWYSGDTGFHDDFAKIGERLGPFDLTLVETGQYDANWPDTHLGPELAVQAHRLVRGKVLMPVHWGLLRLAPHPWTEPVERVLAAARCHGVDIVVPRPGESVEPATFSNREPWWPRLPWRSAADYAVVATKNGESSDRVALPPCQRETN